MRARSRWSLNDPPMHYSFSVVLVWKAQKLAESKYPAGLQLLASTRVAMYLEYREVGAGKFRSDTGNLCSGGVYVYIDTCYYRCWVKWRTNIFYLCFGEKGFVYDYSGFVLLEIRLFVQVFRCCNAINF